MKPSTSNTTNITAAFKQKNVLTEKEINHKPLKVQEVYQEEESIINVTTEDVSWSGEGLETSASFT